MANVHNFCMLAHVDHGKTTLTDFLLSSNGILSEALAGKVRLLDSRPDEQEKTITMKASCVALRHKKEGKEHLLHLIDSPGHIDFSSEVSAALRLCDGALIIVDLVDGVTVQTHCMLRSAFREGLTMCLVLNKLDLLNRAPSDETSRSVPKNVLRDPRVQRSTGCLREPVADCWWQ